MRDLHSITSLLSPVRAFTNIISEYGIQDIRVQKIVVSMGVFATVGVMAILQCRKWCLVDQLPAESGISGKAWRVGVTSLIVFTVLYGMHSIAINAMASALLPCPAVWPKELSCPDLYKQLTADSVSGYIGCFNCADQWGYGMIVTRS